MPIYSNSIGGVGMYNWEQNLERLLDSGSIGIYQCCQVDQIVILDRKSNIAWNYFTHVHFSKEYTTEAESVLLRSPVSLEENLTLFVSRYSMSKEKFKECVSSALSTNIWNYTDSRITEGDQIDGAFPTPIKYIAENDPTGSLYNCVIPFEKSLYGSNFIGNYYIFEVYARGDFLKKVLTDKNIERIQSVLKQCKLNYRLDELTDRIGNVVCRFNVETLKVTPKALGNYGMAYSYELAPNINHEVHLRFHIEQEHDRLIYEYADEDVCLKSGEVIERGVDPHQCKTTITVTDCKTNLILFRAISDQSIYSNYRGQITPGTLVANSDYNYRTINLNGTKYFIPLDKVQFLGQLEFLIEMTEAGKRQQKWEDNFFKEHKYLNVYSTGEHDRAISDLRSIINGYLLWDLQEIRIIDPYLSSEDILNTAAFCEKQNIRVCCLTDIHTISRNKDAKKELLPEENEGTNEDNYNKILIMLRQQLESGIGRDTDLRLSFRSVHGNNGTSFHDRYLILKFGINKTRVWSLGTSINSVGKSHHIIQIVESPMLIDNFFDEVWQKTADEGCKIYDYADYIESEVDN